MLKQQVIKKILEDNIPIEQLSADEVKLFEEHELEELLKIVSSFNEIETPAPTDMQAFRKATFEKSIWQHENDAKLKTKIRFIEKYNPLIKWAAAASILLIGYFSINYIYQNSSKVTQFTNNMELRDVLLPDSSVITLNAASSVVFNKNKWEQHRQVYLEGEAFFKVKKGSTFTISSNNGFTTQVLGTSFNIRSRGSSYKVACATGRVLVKAPNGTSYTLTKGLSTKNNADNSLVEPYELDPTIVTSWTTGHIQFKDEHLTAVIKELERQFNIEIKVKNPNVVNGRKYSGHFYTNNLNNALQLVFLPMNIEYINNNQNNTVILK